MGSPSEKTAISRTEEGPLALLRAALAVGLTLLGIAWALDLYRVVGLLLFPEQLLSAILAMALPLVFLSLPAQRGKRRQCIPAYDLAAALFGFATAAFMAVRFPVLSELIADQPLDGVIASFVMVVLLIEALRRTVGLVLTGMILAFLIYALIGHWISGPLTIFCNIAGRICVIVASGETSRRNRRP